eukprot:403366575
MSRNNKNNSNIKSTPFNKQQEFSSPLAEFRAQHQNHDLPFESHNHINQQDTTIMHTLMNPNDQSIIGLQQDQPAIKMNNYTSNYQRDKAYGSEQSLQNEMQSSTNILANSYDQPNEQNAMKQYIYFGSAENQLRNNQKLTNQSPGSMIGTFAAVLFFTMLKEAYEDFQRYKSDRELNNRETRILDPISGKIKDILWSQVKIGDVDVVFISTMNLDGETNLKERTLPIECLTQDNLQDFEGQIVCDKPGESLDFWDGNIHSQMLPRVTNCNIKNTILRGCTLKNTEFCYGIVLYVGNDTKIMKNAKKAPRKISYLMKLMNLMLYTVFAFQIFIVALFAILSLSWSEENAKKHFYLKLNSKEDFGSWIIQFFTYWVAYSHMIPISLYVIIELLKLGQATLINRDIKMYNRDDKNFAMCRNSDLIEELGQVEFIFSDKTGTLTQNKMQFKKISVGGKIYGRLLSNETENSEGMCTSSVSIIQDQIKSYNKNTKLNQKIDSFNDGLQLHLFFNLLAVCHTVVCDVDVKTQVMQYQASSPDELALSMGAKQIGYELIARSANEIIIQNILTKEKETYKVFAEFPFDSTRKRMSLIVQAPDNQIYLLNAQLIKQKTLQDLNAFAVEGLRTLCMGKRKLSSQQYQEFADNYQQLKTSIESDKDARLNDLFDQMEQDLEYVGSSAIEDKLQDGVPETIAKLIETDIRVWVLTGDKQETAIEIGKSCQLIQEDMEEVIMSSESLEEFSTKLYEQIQRRHISIHKSCDTIIQEFKQSYRNQRRICIIIDGPTLAFAFSEPKIANAFFRFGLLASSVICCRVSPKQKADVVGLAKQNGKWITLSIGDGANDVSMILEAHIGVGIRGKEGTQAVRSADYAISQFRYLHRLLLVHGRWGYRRVSWMVCYYFYKNIILVFTEIYFAFYNGYSGQIFFCDWLPMLYNAVWTSWHCLFAYDVNDQYVYRYPVVYKAGQLSKYFSFKVFWRWIILSVWHGAVCFYGVMIPMGGAQDEQGRSYEHWLLSTASFTLIVHVIIYKLFIETVYWNTVSLVTCFACLFLYYSIIFVGNSNGLASLVQPQLNGQVNLMFQLPKFWVSLISVPWVALLPDIAYLIIQKVIYPTPTDGVMRIQLQNPKFKYMGFPDYDNQNQTLSPNIKQQNASDNLNSKKQKDSFNNHNKDPKDFDQIFNPQKLKLNKNSSDEQNIVNGPESGNKQKSSQINEQEEEQKLQTQNPSQFKKINVNVQNQVIGETSAKKVIKNL